MNILLTINNLISTFYIRDTILETIMLIRYKSKYNYNFFLNNV